MQWDTYTINKVMNDINKKLWENWLEGDNLPTRLNDVFNTDGSKVDGHWERGYYIPKGSNMKARQLMENVTEAYDVLYKVKSKDGTMFDIMKDPKGGDDLVAMHSDPNSTDQDGPFDFDDKNSMIHHHTGKMKVMKEEITNEGSPANNQLVKIDNMHSAMKRAILQIPTMDDGDLTDQVTTMIKHLDGLEAVIKRSFAIIPEGISEDDFQDGHNLELLKAVAKQFQEDVDMEDYTAIDDLLKDIPEARLKGYLSQEESIEEEITFENYAVAAAEAHKAGKKEFEYPKGSGKMHKVTISPEAAKKITDEGYSKHKKGTKKYKMHMAAMHAAKAGK